MTTDLPDYTMHEKRAMYYIQDINKNRDSPANISTLSRESEWNSKYFTRAWKRLEPKGLVKTHKEGNTTELELTGKGKKVIDLYLEMNEVLE